MRESSDPVTNMSPRIATTSAATPILFPGINANSETASASVNAARAAEARTRWIWVSPRSASRDWETEMDTNSSPMSAPATPALARKKSPRPAGFTPPAPTGVARFFPDPR